MLLDVLLADLVLAALESLLHHFSFWSLVASGVLALYVLAQILNSCLVNSCDLTSRDRLVVDCPSSARVPPLGLLLE